MNTALITGASRGFGQALASALADQDWNLVIDARNSEPLQKAAEELHTRGAGRIVARAGSVTDRDHLRLMVDSAVELGGFRLLVNNASSLGPSPMPLLADIDLDSFRTVLDINVVAPLALTQMALPHLRSLGGSIVNISSDAAVENYANWGGYGASKAALDQLSNVMAIEEASVRLFWFDPGDMRTAMHQDAFPGEDISDRPLPETKVPALLELISGNYPSGRYAADRMPSKSVA